MLEGTYSERVSRSTVQDKHERPTALPVNFDGIPDGMKRRKQWSVWRYTKRAKGGWTKVPFMAREAKKAWNSDPERRAKWNEEQAQKAAKDKREWREKDRSSASSTDPETWSSFEDAKRTYERSQSSSNYRYDGVGFALDGKVDENGLTIAAVDIDKVTDDPKRLARAQEIIEAIGSYTEKSPSGKGYRIFLKAKPRESVTHDGLEFYAGIGRYLTVTGHVVGGANV
jgi:putative DNA primase/helicase